MLVNKRKHFRCNTLNTFQVLQEKLLPGPVNTLKSCDLFLKGVFFQQKDVLQRLLHERTRTRSAAIVVVVNLAIRWICCNVCCLNVDGIVSRIQKQVKDFHIKSQPKIGKKGASACATFKSNMSFLSDFGKLFDIFCNNQKQLPKLEKFHHLKIKLH